MTKNDKKQVAVLGATGVVGQVFLSLLTRHPWFEISVISGSDTRSDKYYKDEVHWVLPFPMPGAVGDLKLSALDISILEKKKVKFVFSALPNDVAQDIEPVLRERGFYVFSNAAVMRYDENVPILIPEVNGESVKRIEAQGFPSKGFVITNANCTATGLVTALAPLRRFGIEEVFVSTYQSVSGAGYPGIPVLDILGNAIPFIREEEEKIKIELKKMLEINPGVYAHCVRVPVLFGHLETVWLTFEKPVETRDILDAWRDFSFKSPYSNTILPSIPGQPVEYINNERFPQPQMSFWGTPPGMQVFTGRLRKEGRRIGFSLLVNNLVKGAAGGSVANAELFLDTYREQIADQSL